jgi:hypothetical protein
LRQVEYFYINIAVFAELVRLTVYIFSETVFSLSPKKHDVRLDHTEALVRTVLPSVTLIVAVSFPLKKIIELYSNINNKNN